MGGLGRPPTPVWAWLQDEEEVGPPVGARLLDIEEIWSPRTPRNYKIEALSPEPRPARP